MAHGGPALAKGPVQGKFIWTNVPRVSLKVLVQIGIGP